MVLIMRLGPPGAAYGNRPMYMTRGNAMMRLFGGSAEMQIMKYVGMVIGNEVMRVQKSTERN